MPLRIGQEVEILTSKSPVKRGTIVGTATIEADGRTPMINRARGLHLLYVVHIGESKYVEGGYGTVSMIVCDPSAIREV